MISVKGMTTCTPEFHREAKSAELEAEANFEIKSRIDALDANDWDDHASMEVFADCRQQAKVYFGLFDESEVFE